MGPQSADARRRHPRHQAADRRRRAIRQREVRRRPCAGGSTFVAQRTRSTLASPSLLFQVEARASRPQEKDAEAIAAWETSISKFPGSEPASHAQFVIASIYENREGEPRPGDRAVQENRGRAVASRSAPAQQIAVMESLHEELTGHHRRALPLGRDAAFEGRRRETWRGLDILGVQAQRRGVFPGQEAGRLTRSSRSTSASSRPDAESTFPVPEATPSTSRSSRPMISRVEAPRRLGREGQR